VKSNTIPFTLIAIAFMALAIIFILTYKHKSQPKEEGVELVHRAAAEEQFFRNLCREDCLPSPMVKYVKSTGECECAQPSP